MEHFLQRRALGRPLAVAILILLAASITGVTRAETLAGGVHGRTLAGGIQNETMAASDGIWLSPSEVRALPTSGKAWKKVKAAADGSLGTPEIRDPGSNHDVKTLAVALVAVRTGAGSYFTKATEAIKAAMGTEEGGTVLALARNLAPYVIAADLIGLSGSADTDFRSWLRAVVDKRMSDGDTLREMHGRRPNNIGTQSGASRAAAAAYLGDSRDLATTAQIFKGWLGDTSSWSSFRWGDLDWQCDSSQPVGINPPGCMKEGMPIDGVLPDDQRRGGGFTWPPPKENYVYGALQGALVQAEILHRAGYATWEWQSRALLRAFDWLHTQADFPAGGDDEWQPWLVNHRYGSSFPAELPARHGKLMGWTDWTHGSRR